VKKKKKRLFSVIPTQTFENREKMKTKWNF